MPGLQCYKETEKKTKNVRKMSEKKVVKGGMKRPFLWTTPRISHEKWSNTAHNSRRNETKNGAFKTKSTLGPSYEVRPLPKRLDFGEPRHEINCSAPFRNVRWVEELHEFADQLRMLKL
jgi:hypothetical protein